MIEPKCPLAKMSKENIHFKHDCQMKTFKKGETLIHKFQMNVRKTLEYN